MVNSSTTRAFFSSPARIENQSGPSGFRIRPLFTLVESRAPAGLSRTGGAGPFTPIGTFSEQICKNRKKGVDILLPACYTSKCSAAEHTARGYSSAGRALDWQSRGQRFDPAYLHQNDTTFRRVVFLFPMLFVRSFQHTQHAPAADSLVRGGRVCFLQSRFLLDQKIPRCSSRILLPSSTRMIPPASSARRW